MTEEFRYIPALESSSLLLVIPFFNERLAIPSILASLEVSSRSLGENPYILGVNHRSSDGSELIFGEQGSGFAKVGIIREEADLKSVGIPRQTGIRTAVEMVSKADHKVVIGSIDADSRVSSQFFAEAERFRLSTDDFLVFPTRNDQQYFLDCVDAQDDARTRASAIKTLVGIDWLKYQLRDVLLQAGAVETRGSGGYFFTLAGYEKAVGHKPVYAADGTIVTGESNAVGIRAKRNGANAMISSYVNTASPRRILKAIGSSTDGYSISSAGKTYNTVQADNNFPTLSVERWQSQYEAMLYGAIRTFVIKALAYEVVPNVIERITIPTMKRLLQLSEKLYQDTGFVGDERDAIGSRTYIKIFEQAWEEIGETNQKTTLAFITGKLPTESGLLEWASDPSELISADKLFS